MTPNCVYITMLWQFSLNHYNEVTLALWRLKSSATWNRSFRLTLKNIKVFILYLVGYSNVSLPKFLYGWVCTYGKRFYWDFCFMMLCTFCNVANPDGHPFARYNFQFVACPPLRRLCNAYPVLYLTRTSLFVLWIDHKFVSPPIFVTLYDAGPLFTKEWVDRFTFHCKDTV